MHCKPDCVRTKPFGKTQHCGICHRSYTPGCAGKHRVPKETFTDSSGRVRRVSYLNRCLDLPELIEQGFEQREDGVWTIPMSDEVKKRRGIAS